MRLGIAAIFCAPLLLHSHEIAPGGKESEVSREVDRLLSAGWEKEKISPSELSTDGEFLRRVYLDLVGRIPTLEETVGFLNEPNSDKRRKKVDELLASPEYAKNFARIWTIRLLGRDANRRVNNATRNPFEDWLQKQFEENAKWDAMAKEIIGAEGSTENPEEGAVAYGVRWSFRAMQDAPANLAGQTVKVFMGTRLQCAQCHDHPYESWTQKDFWGVAAYFARVRPQPIKDKEKKDRIIGFQLTDLKRGEVKLPNSNTIVEPKFIGSSQKSATGSRRAAVADLIASKENPAFAKALVNWMWFHFFGVAFVNPVDDFNSQNKPSNPELLDLLARDFADNGYDLKRLIRIIVSTKAYQLSSKSSKTNSRDRAYFSKSQVRPMSPEELFYSLAVATGLEDLFKEQQKRAKGQTLEKLLEEAMTRFTILFDNDEMSETLDFEATVTQALFMMNGRLSTDMLKARVGTLHRIFERQKTPQDRIEQIYLTAYSRPPSSDEKRRFTDYIRQQGDREETYVDILWVLLNSTEFFFNH